MLLLDTNYDGAFVDSIHLPICPKKYWVLLCMIDFEEILGDWVSLNWGMEFKPHYDIFRTPLWKQVSSVWAPLHLTMKLPAHWKLNLPSFKTEAPFQKMIFTRKFRLQKLALISVFHFFLSAILLHHNQLLGIIDGTQAHSPSGQSLQFYQSSPKRWWDLETLGCYVLWSYKQM